MTTPTESLSVVLDLPPAPLVLASGDFLSTLAQVEGQIATLAIKDPQTAQQAADLQTRLTKAGTELEKARKNLKQPYIDAGRKIDEIAIAPALRIEAAKSSVKRLLVAYDQEQARIAADLERKRQEELRKLREQAEAEERETRRKAQEAAEAAAALAAASAAPVMELDDEPEAPPPKTETEKKIEALVHAPVAVVAKPGGVSFRVTLVPIVEDVNKLPDMFVVKTANNRAIIATFCTGYKDGAPLPVCEGVRFEVKRESVSTGRQTF